MYLIDGYNLLHALKKLGSHFPSDFRHGRKLMVDLLGQMARREKAAVTIYFDGTPGVGGAPELDGGSQVRCIFTAGDADSALRKAVRDSLDPHRLTVVSTDREVAGPCRDEGARTRKSEEIAQRLLRLADGERREQALGSASIVHAIGEMEEEMLAEVGDFDELVEDALSEPQPELPWQARKDRNKRRR